MKDKMFLILVALMLVFDCTTAFGGGNSESTNGNNTSGTQPGNVLETHTGNVSDIHTAVDLVQALGGGNATANGNTVTLTNGIGVQNDITIPAGVTLELTENSGLWLLDGIILTVNGTINTPANRIGFDGGTNARQITINGNGTINLIGKGTLLNVWGGDGINRKLTVDGVTLVGVADNNNSLVGVYDGGEIVLLSGTITGNTRNNAENFAGGGVDIYQATFIMESGEITGNTVIGNNYAEGGGVKVQEGTFIMRGGEISGNTSRSATNNGIGGGLRFAGGADCTFIMTSGKITGNFAIGGVGGGLSFDCGNGVFTMEGGEISGNSAGRGGGVFIGGGTLTMKGGTIYGSADRLPSGTDTSLANSAQEGATLAGLINDIRHAFWGTGGTYTRGGVNQTGGSDIVRGSTNETLIAIPAR
jgi:hypothetical protein